MVTVSFNIDDLHVFEELFEQFAGYQQFKSDVLARLDGIIASQAVETQRELNIMATMTEVVDKIAEETTLVASLQTFVQGLRDQIAALPGVTPELQAQIDGAFAHVSANATAIANAMVANTPPPVA